MNFIAMGFEPNENALKVRLRHWFRFDHLRPEQGIALLIGLEADDVYIKAIADWGKDKSKDKNILDFGISLLNGDEITSKTIKSSYDECIDTDENANFIEYDDSLKGGCDCSTEAEYDDNYYEQYANFLEEEHANFCKDASARFANLVQQHRHLLQYWNSGEHHKPTPLVCFVEWARLKGIRPSWEHIAVELGKIPGGTSVNDGKHPKNPINTDSERDRLLKQIGALALTLAEKSNQYKRSSGKPNALEIAKNTILILDALPDANSRGVGESNVRESIRAGIELLTAIKR